MTTNPIRIILVDDHKIVRESWRLLLESNPQFKVVADCDNGREAVDRACEIQPDIVLLDLNMLPMSGFEVAEQLAQQAPTVKIIGLSVNNQPRYAIRMLELGAKGYLTKTSPFQEITHGIFEVNNGKQYICDEIRLHMNDTVTVNRV